MRSVSRVHLSLEWDEPSIFVVNRGASVWEEDANEHWAFIGVFDGITGEPMPAHEATVGAGGRSYRLEPGERVRVPSVLTVYPGALSEGKEYEMEAVIPELSLRSPRKSFTWVRQSDTNGD
jgi:hypothetical protein